MTIALLFIINRSNATNSFFECELFCNKRENLFYHKITLQDALIFGRC
jgi:hypothetical protein